MNDISLITTSFEHEPLLAPMTLDSEVRMLLNEQNAAKTGSIWDLSFEQIRSQTDARLARLAGAGPEIESVEDLDIPGPYRDIRLRIYKPEGVTPGESLPVFINFHGSGFVVCNIDSYDHVCRIICKKTECIVVAVDYCKAPEFKFPMPVEEAWAATCWICMNAPSLGGDDKRVAIGGDSAGAGIATVIAQRALIKGGPQLVHQLLVYPVTDTDTTTPSYRRFGRGYSLELEQMKWFFHCYFAEEKDRSDLRATPLRLHNLSGMPPTTIILAGHDPLFSDGYTYAHRLVEAGVETETVVFAGAIHGFWTATARLHMMSDGAHEKAANALRRTFDA